MNKTFPYSAFEWYGNDELFGTKDEQDSVSDSYMKYQIYINENISYEEMAAIMQTNQLFNKHKIIVHTRCESLNRQLNEWSVDNGKPESLGKRAKYDNAEVLALCNISNMLFETKKIKLEGLKEYSPAKTNFIETVQSIKDDEGLVELARGRMPVRTNTNPNEWMRI